MDFKVFIEIPAGSAVKYEVDEETGELMVDRFMFTSFVYPLDYGYIQGTKGEDGDALDALILSSQAVMPGVVMKCHAIGMLEMEDEDGVDTKILAVPDAKIDPIYGGYKDIGEVSEAILERMRHFFEKYKDLEKGKWVKLKDYKGASEAEKVIKASKI